jgi:hypothetical protein
MKKTSIVIITLGFSSVCLAADPVVKSAIGGAIGGAAGAAVGQEVGGKKGAVVGGAVGGALGGAASNCGSGAVVGGAVGGAAGTAIGQSAGGKRGAVVGGGAGGAAGAAIGCDLTSDKKPQRQPVVVTEERRYRPVQHSAVRVPPGHMPPPGSCRVWFPDRPPGHQPPPGDCRELRHRVPQGAVLVGG